MKMKMNHTFNINGFISPDVSFAPVYVWVWNDKCSKEIIDDQLSEMQTLGIRAFYILPEPKAFRPHSMPTNLDPDYLSKEFFELCAYAVSKGKELGMLCWIYDEGGWPSGGACGKVMRDHPEFAKSTLETKKTNFCAGEVYQKSSSDVIAAFAENKMINEGFSFVSDCSVDEYYIESDISGGSDYPDLLNKNATDYFIKITHEKYAEYLESEFGKTVKAVFTDEPKAPAYAFSKRLAVLYEKEYGESILPYLPLIAEDIEATEQNVHILHRWYDMLSKEFCGSFLLPCKKWVNDYGAKFSGHMDKDHDPLGCVNGGNNFNLMRALRCFDIPGIDVIWRQLYPENLTTVKDDMNAYNGFFPRYASSAAAQNGTDLAMTESFGVAGPGLTYDIMRYTVGYQAVRGINVFNFFNFPLGRKGTYLAQELPVFTENQMYYRHLGEFNRYIERLSYLYTVGKRVCDTALYYPVKDFQGRLNAKKVSEKFDSLGRALEEMIVDFDIVDDDIIQSAPGIDEGFIRAGSASYKNIIIPEGAFVPEETAKILNRFINGGGIVRNDINGILPVIKADKTGLRAMLRKSEKDELLFLFRESGDSGDYRISLPFTNGYLIDPLSGEIRRFETDNGILSISLAVGETAVIISTNEKLSSYNLKKYNKKIEIRNGFLLRKESELTIDDNGFGIINHPDKKIPVDLGDWSNITGKAYSGSCVYETEFELSDEYIGKAGEIDLGEVRFTAEVCLNGVSLGTALMPPYRLSFGERILKKQNTLKVTVTNTSANLYAYTDYFDKWKIEELSPYFEAEKSYAEDYASGGLSGPVELYIW